MNKKLMALAVAGAFAAPAAALAQAEIYGRANVGFNTYSATGSTLGAGDFKTRNVVYDNGSRVGFRGNENLGGGLKAVYVIETGVNIDTGTVNTQSGNTNTSTGTWATRDSYAGLEGDWGRVTFGRQSIYWGEGVIAQSGTNYINVDVATTGALGRVVGPAARTSNTVAYNSPTTSGMNFTVSYAPNSEAALPGVETNAKIYGVTGRYFGVINGQVDYAVNEGTSGAATGTPKNSGFKLGVGYPYAPGAQIAVVYISEKNDNLAAAIATFANAGDSVKANAVIVNWEHTFGNIQGLAEVGKVQKATGCGVANGCNGTDATAYMVAARYLLSKRTAVYASYNKIRNGSNNTMDISGGGASSAAAASGGFLPNGSQGADPQLVAVGIIHNF
ncbi:MAG TPA: porin [Burkholderiales bacterium]|nr:porin [Burkholderiales bacterium]